MNEKEIVKNLVFIDTETTGIGEEDRVFQVAYDLDGDEKQSLFKPPLPLCIEAMETTHFTNRDVEDKEDFAGSETEKDLREIFIDKKNVFVAHNAKFDLKMLEKEGLEFFDYIDTLKLARHLDPNGKLGAYRLQYLRYALDLGVDDAPAHDALGDIRVLKALFLRLYKKMEGDFESREAILEKMVEVSKLPALIKKFVFGKYKGSTVEEVAAKDKGYLEWLLKQKETQAAEGDVDEDWIYTLKKYL